MTSEHRREARLYARSIESLVGQLREELGSIHNEARSYCAFIDESPDLSRLLTEYAGAKDDERRHFERFGYIASDQQPEEIREACCADWSRCCERVRTAQDKLARFAEVYVALKSENEAA